MRALPLRPAFFLLLAIGGCVQPAQAAAADCGGIVKQLYRMATEDQAIRAQRQSLPFGDRSLDGRMKAVDRENTRALKGILKRCGWPVASKYGEPASAAAWLVTQHADADPAFQRDVLRMLGPLLDSGEVSKRDYAYLTDRVELKRTGKQVYGTQLMVTERGVELPAEQIDERAAIDRRRAEMGLEPLDAYIERVRRSVQDDPKLDAAPSAPK